MWERNEDHSGQEEEANEEAWDWMALMLYMIMLCWSAI